MIRFTFGTSCAAALVLPASLAHGQVTGTTDRAAFEAGLTGTPITLTFDGQPDVDFTPAEILAGVDFGPFTVTGTPDPAAGDVTVEGEELGLFLFSTDANLFTLDFDAPISGFGADFRAVNANATGITIDGETIDLFATIGGSAGFAGFTTDTPVTSLSFANLPGSTIDLFFLDNITFDVVPEPASAALLAVAGSAALLRRRRA